MLMIFFLTSSSESDKYIQLPNDLLILALPSSPGNLEQSLFLGSKISGSTKVLP